MQWDHLNAEVHTALTTGDDNSLALRRWFFGILPHKLIARIKMCRLLQLPGAYTVQL